MWTMLCEIAEREGVDVSAIVRRIDAAGRDGGRTSAVRVYIARYFRAASTEAGHVAAGHPTTGG